MPSLLFICRPEFASALAAEIHAKMVCEHQVQPIAEGLVLLTTPVRPVIAELIFERQRLVEPVRISLDQLKPVSAAVTAELLGPIVSGHPLWTVHLNAIEQDENSGNTPTSLTKRVEGIWNSIMREGKKIAPDLEKRFRPPHRLKPGGWVLQLLLTSGGLWYSRELIETMINPRPGGYSRMKWDARAPSRSYLKMEEALDRLRIDPSAGDKVIDLGAAPGGWTYAFYKRGCQVIAVDHGPMKLPPREEGWGEVQHLRQNGITYMPPAHWPVVDWLVADMLIAPGVALGLLRRWIESQRARRIICNIKLPQESPYIALHPIETYLSHQPNYIFQIKQLYHDRREITAIGAHKTGVSP